MQVVIRIREKWLEDDADPFRDLLGSQRGIGSRDVGECPLQRFGIRHDAVDLHKSRVGIGIDGIGVLRVVIPTALVVVRPTVVLIPSPEHVARFMGKGGHGAGGRDDFEQPTGK